MAIPLAIDEDYGYVIIVGVLGVFFGWLLGVNVFFARRYFDIKYPVMFSETNMKFNCMQRVHGNYLEMLPTFLILLFCGGLAHPLNCAIAGVVYLLGRLVYSIGYSSGNPNGRLFGLFYYFGLIYLLYSSLELAVRLLRWI
ncbi:microsomal glutathione S-transferase 3-like [Uloborus diversus]|uniref:microsomal glutathione S-transferase 3-like n=1 Tax=Uloborus diversus TaxID=327109 RepID=UPI002409F948|nr:microsomal glutathione S-transferase 3-like [Uloborus diversus]